MAFAHIDHNIENLKNNELRELYIAVHSAVITINKIELLKNKSILDEIEKENDDNSLDGVVNNFRAIYELSSLQIYQYERTFKQLITDWNSPQTRNIVLGFISSAKEKYSAVFSFILNKY
jgi:hypothetical protein